MAIANVELDGKTLSLETGTLAKQADGAVVVRIGDTITLVTVGVAAPREGIDFFPLLVDFEEKMYAAGKIPGVRYIRREGRPSENAILTARRIDRSIRPLFPEGFRNDVQVVATVLSADPENAPDVAALLGASAALSISSAPFQGPVGAVRVGRIDGEFVVNPTYEQLDQSDLDLIVSMAPSGVVMLEGLADQLPEEVIAAAVEFAGPHCQALIEAQRQFAAEAGKEKLEVAQSTISPEVKEAIARHADTIRETIQNPDKKARENATAALLEQLASELAEEFPERASEVRQALEKQAYKELAHLVLDGGRRPDGRRIDEVRPISCAVGLLPRTHGSALFTRGQTQVMSVVTLGGVGEEQLIDDLGMVESKRFMHHYNFPPYSVGEVRPLRGAGRREIGHGSLAEKALLPLLPEEDDFPYTVRVVSEVLESNGSSSMASVCGASLALMDAGVPIRSAVAGISIGRVVDGGRQQLLTDIQGLEDFGGGMDFKVAGTRTGITAMQVDVKGDGLTHETVRQALAQARQAHFQILDIMAQTIDQPRPELAPHAPRVYTIEINPDKIGDVIGPGGKTIKKLEADFDVKIDIEQDGRIFVAAADQARGSRAVQTIQDITRDLQVGEVYMGKVVRIVPFGAFIELVPGRDGLLHISQISKERIEKVEDALQLGDELEVRIIEIDPQGKVRLSRKEAVRPIEAAPPRGDRGDRGGDRGGRRGGHRR